MKFKDVAHLHAGCKVQWMGQPEYPTYYKLTPSFIGFVYNGGNYKPILYPLSEMTEVQRSEVHKLMMETFDHDGAMFCHTPESFKWLLDNHFDIFNLIGQDEAIDATTIKDDLYKNTEIITLKQLKNGDKGIVTRWVNQPDYIGRPIEMIDDNLIMTDKNGFKITYIDARYPEFTKIQLIK